MPGAGVDPQRGAHTLEDVTQLPLLGIFWGVRNGGHIQLVTDTTPLAEGERYGGFLTHSGGHFDVWEAWRKLGPAGLAKRGLPAVIASYEYEDFPRGRVVYHTLTRRFTVYADRRLQSRAMVASILDAFRVLPQQCSIRSDEHYRSGNDR